MKPTSFWFWGFLVVTFLFSAFGIFSQSLWQDHNPYAVGSNLRSGTILKLDIDEPVQIIYEYENLADENIDIRLVPDRNITAFLPPANASRSVVKRYTNRLNSRSRMRLKMAVTVQADPQNGSVRFTGTKFLGQENNISRQQIQVSGRVHIEDIDSGRVVRSDHVADLQIVVIGAPVPRTKNLPLPEQPEQQEQSDSGAAETEEASRAKLTREQKQQLLWEYINRLLGEISPQ